MGKRTRSDTDDYEYIAKKVKKLNQRLMRARHKSRRRTSSSSSESDSSSSSSSSRSPSPRPRSRVQPSPTTMTRDALCIEDAPGCTSKDAAPVPSTSAAGEFLPSTSATDKPTTSTNAADELTPSNEAATVPQPTVSDVLNEDLLKILGDDPSQKTLYGKDIQPDLAIRLQHIATFGLDKDVRKGLLDKYLPPANCPLIDAPALNPEVKAAIPEPIYKRDKAIEQKQKQLASVTSCLAEAITALMVESKDTAIIKLLMDASKLLCDAQYSDSLTRRNFVLNNIKRELKDQLQATKIDKLLFSEELSDTLKAAKAISRSSADMKLTTISKNPPKKSLKPTKNWRAPPPSQGRPKGTQRTKEPAYKNRHENSSKQSSNPTPIRSRRR